MSSHWEYVDRVVAEHDDNKPFAPENGQPLKFKTGDAVIYTNPNGIEYYLTVKGLYERQTQGAMYARGARYLLDWSCHWYPAMEANMRAATLSKDDYIRIDRRLRPRKNNLGQEIASTDEGLCNFWKWFGDSKTVDDQDRPVVKFHGTEADFQQFRHGDVGFHVGSAKAANSRMDDALRDDGLKLHSPHIMPLYVAIKNPLRLPDVGDWGNPDSIVNTLADLLVQDDELCERYEAAAYSTPETGDNLQGFRAVFERMGFDGVVYDNVGEGGGDSHIAFHPTQIKSATANNGSFNPEDHSILQ
jgi:hypothetical protein